MRGIRFWIAFFVMGLAVPAILAPILGLTTFGEWFAVGVTCLIAWGITDFCGRILTRPRLRDRNAKAVIEQWRGERSGDRPF